MSGQLCRPSELHIVYLLPCGAGRNCAGLPTGLPAGARAQQATNLRSLLQAGSSGVGTARLVLRVTTQS